MSKRCFRPERALTLIEVVITLAIVSVMLLATTQIMVMSKNAIQTGSIDTYLQTRALSIVDEIANDVKEGIKTTVTSSGTSITFNRCAGYTNNKVVVGDSVTYAVTLIKGSYCIQRTEPMGTSIVCDALVKNGMNIQVAGDVVTITVMMQDAYRRTGSARLVTATATATTKTQIKN